MVMPEDDNRPTKGIADCYVRSARNTPVRSHFERLVMMSLRYQSELHGGFASPHLIQNFPPLKSFYVAKEDGAAELMIFSDNDVIFPSPMTLLAGLTVMWKNPELGALGFRYKAGLRVLDLAGHFVATCGDYWEVLSTGTVLILRREAMPEIHEIAPVSRKEGFGDDLMLCQGIRAKGFKIGMLASSDHHFIHLGEGYSTTFDESEKPEKYDERGYPAA